MSEHKCKYETLIEGNGKPGMVQDLAAVKRALYGDKPNNVPGVIERQQDILNFVNDLKPFLSRPVLLIMFGLSALACLKVLGGDHIINIINALRNF